MLVSLLNIRDNLKTLPWSNKDNCLKKILSFDGGNLDIPLSSEEKSRSLSLYNFLTLDCLEFGEYQRKKPERQEVKK